MRESAIAANIPILEYCKDGWYLPARNEMEAVFTAYNGGPSQSIGVKPDAIKQEEKDARAAWDKILTDNGGDVMNEKLTIPLVTAISPVRKRMMLRKYSMCVSDSGTPV